MYSGGAAGAAPTGPTPPAAPQKAANEYAGYGGYAGYPSQVSPFLFAFWNNINKSLLFYNIYVHLFCPQYKQWRNLKASIWLLNLRQAFGIQCVTFLCRQVLLCTLLFNIAARNDLNANFGLKPIVYQTFFMLLDFEAWQAFWSTTHVSAGHKVLKASI